MVHSEFLTHRVFSRNASSSRAIPVAKMIEDLRRDPAMPVHWGKNQSGMQAHEELTEQEVEACKREWLKARDDAIASAQGLMALGLHKQIANRILEPWGHINVIVTSSAWSNFFELRAHPDAQPEIHALAVAMKIHMEESVPRPLVHGQWHLPYVTAEEMALHPEEAVDHLIRLSVARCARVSYLTHEGRAPNAEEDLRLYDRLVGSRPLHASPAEHQASPDVRDGDGTWWSPHLHGNFTGWVQYRKVLEGTILS